MVIDTLQKEEILFISSIQLHPAESGGQLRSLNICKALSKIGHKVSIYSFTGRKEEYLSNKKFSKVKLNNNLSEYVNYSRLNGILQFLSYKLSLPPFWITLLTKLFIPIRLTEMLIKADVIILDFPFLYPLISSHSKNMILNTHNAEFTFHYQKTIKDFILKAIVLNIEKSSFSKIHNVIFCSPTDLASFTDLNIQIENPLIIPNGVDTDLFKKDIDRSLISRNRLNISNEKKVILFTGSQFDPNIQAFKFLKKFTNNNHIQLTKMNIIFLVVGTVSKESYSSPNLVVTGRVEHIHDYFFASDYAINPILIGSGTNVKMMEYLAARLPIITTEFGARGLVLEHKTHCFKFNESNLLEILYEIFTDYKNTDLQSLTDKAYKDNQDIFDINIAIKQLSPILKGN